LRFREKHPTIMAARGTGIACRWKLVCSECGALVLLPLDMHGLVAIIAAVNLSLVNIIVDTVIADGHTAGDSGNQLGLAKRIVIGARRCATQAWAGRVHALEFQFHDSCAFEERAACRGRYALALMHDFFRKVTIARDQWV